MKNLVLFHHVNDNRPVVVSDSSELTYRTNMFLMDKWRQTFDVLCGHDKVLDETFYGVTIYGEQFHAESFEQLVSDLKQYHNINVICPFKY